jgi:hypothetical protein
LTADELLQRLTRAEPASPFALALTRDLIEDARYPANFALQKLFASIEPDAQAKARNVLADAHELALVPLAQGSACATVDNEFWVIRTMTAEMTALRIRTTTVVRDLLDNQRPLPVPPEDSRHSQPPPGARVCDLACALLHRLLHLEFDPAVFYGDPVENRDAAIHQFKLSRAFRAAFEKQI